MNKPLNMDGMKARSLRHEWFYPFFDKRFDEFTDRIEGELSFIQQFEGQVKQPTWVLDRGDKL